MKQRIFISSVQSEFAKERAGLKKYIETHPTLSRFFSVFVFELDIPAADQKADEVYLGELKQSNIYIGLIGDKYGSQDADGVSPTEREFDEATRAGLQRLIFIKEGDDAGREPKEQNFLKKIPAELIYRRFSDWDALLTDVYASLDRILATEQAYRQLPFDATLCDRATLDDIDPAKIRWFIGKAVAVRNWRIPVDATTETVLQKLHLLHDGKITNAGVLLFAKDPQDFMLTSEVKCMHYHGTMPHKPIPSYQIYHGNLFDMIDQAVDFVLSKIDRAVGIRDVSNQAPVTYEIPPEVIREAIVNAVCHRDYTSNASVQVMLFSDRLEILSPGPLTSALTVKNLSEIHESYPVNPLIADPFFLAQYAEKAGSGTTDMIESCLRAGLPKPEFRTDPHRFVTILYRKQKTGVIGEEKPMVIDRKKPMVIAPEKNEEKRDFKVKTWGKDPCQKPMVIDRKKPMVIAPEKTGGISKEKSSSKVLEAIRKDHTISRKELVAVTGLSGPGVDWQIRSLKKAGKLDRVGTTRKGFWVILEEQDKK